MISNKTKDKWKTRIIYCWEHRMKMDDYDFDFIRSIHIRFIYNKADLTLRQSFYLNRVFYKLERSDI